jgi:hypothetical protein
MKTLVTHLRPHLDDICAIWLFKKYQPDFKEAKIEFVPLSTTALEETDDRIFLGTGRGRFDEHKGDVEDCATSLVWKFLVKDGFAPKDESEFKAQEVLVEWSRLIDLGRAPLQEFGEFSVQAFIRPKEEDEKSSLKAVEMGDWILDQILDRLIDKQLDLKDWKDHIGFTTKFGKSYAVKSDTIGRPFCKEQGGDLFLIYKPKNGNVQYFTPSMEIDLEPIYKKLKELEPKSNWYLHQSHHMVLSGPTSKTDGDQTKLTFEQLIEAAKSI